MKNKHLSKIVSAIFIAAMIFNIIPFVERQAKAALVPGGAVGPVNPNTGFPNWYMDQNGLALELMEAADSFGISDPIDPNNPFSVQIGFGGEAFWWATEALIDSRRADGSPGKALMVLAMEAAFLNEEPVAGDQMAFGRVRFFIDVPEAGIYTVRHPFGTAVFDVSEERIAATNGIRAINANLLAASGFRPDLSVNLALGDVGCEIGPCDFSLALQSGLGPFLTWNTFNLDPALSDPLLVNSSNPGKRYVGNPSVEHAIKGSPVGQNFFEITGPNGFVSRTEEFSVLGRIAVIDTEAPEIEDVSPTEIIVDSLGQIAPNTVISANITDDLGVRAATIDLSAFGNNFTATLNGAQEVPGVASGATGAGTFVIDTVANSLSFNINYSGLVGGAETAAHIHGPAVAGVNALPIFDLPLGASKIGVWNYLENLEADILAGRMYVNVHSILFPNGEIRGQILRTSNVQNMVLTAGTITNGTWGVIIPSITRMGTFSLPITTHDGSNITNFDFQLSVVNPAPVANPDTANVGAGEGEQVDIEVMLNDTDLNGNLPLSLVSVQNVSAGMAVIAPDGQHVIVTAPTPDFVGTITAEYTVADILGATSTGSITVNFEAPVTPPVEIFLVHRNPTFVKVGNEFVDFGAIAFDRDGMFLDDPVVLENTVDTTTPGTYKVVYLANDGLGNTAKALRTVHVIEENVNPLLPSIFPNQDNPVTVEANSDYQDKGVLTAFDILGQDLTALVQTAGLPVDTSTVGTKLVFYTVSDAAGRTSTVLREVNVVDTTPPSITVLGDNPKTVLLNSLYVDEGSTASDGVDGDLTSAIIVSGLPIDTGVAGSKTITYTVSDLSGNTAIVERTVNISADAVSPVITILGDNPVTVLVNTVYADAGATALDDVDGDLTAGIIASGLPLNTSATGTLSITYNITDAAGNTATATRTVNIISNTTPPVITLNGDALIIIEENTNYIDLGATALDAVDGDLTAAIQTSGAVNTSILGGYIITYSVSDTAGNTATSIRTVNVVAATHSAPSSNNGGGGGGSSGGGGGSSGNGGGGGSGFAPVIPPQNFANLALTPQTSNVSGSGSTGQVLGAATHKFNSDLKLGIRGNDVRELKKLLKSKKFYKGSMSNKFNFKLMKALKNYQKSAGLKQTGKLDFATREKLNQSGENTSVKGAVKSLTSAQSLKKSTKKTKIVKRVKLKKVKLLKSEMTKNVAAL